MAKKKILFFLNSGTGGAERVTITIGKMLPANQYEVVFVLAGKSHGTMDQFIPKGYRKEYIIFRNIWLGVGYRFYRLLKREKPYAIFSSSMTFSARLLVAAKKIGGIKTVVRNCNYFKTIRPDELFLCKLTYKYADVIVAQQEEMRQDILNHISLDPKKVIALQNPIDKDYIAEKIKVPSPYRKNDGIKYLWVGRFDKTKGQDVLAEAFVIVAKKNPGAHLYFVGKFNDDEYYYEIKQTVKEGNCEDRVHFIGFDPNPYRWMKNCDCFVLPSRIEGLPNSLIEAQYLGIPAVATTCIPIISRIIENGVTGYTVPSENPPLMAAAMMNAVKLGKIKSSYHGAENSSFLKLFE